MENPQSTKLGLRLQPVPTARAYEVRISHGTSGFRVDEFITRSTQRSALAAQHWAG